MTPATTTPPIPPLLSGCDEKTSQMRRASYWPPRHAAEIAAETVFIPALTIAQQPLGDRLAVSTRAHEFVGKAPYFFKRCDKSHTQRAPWAAYHRNAREGLAYIICRPRLPTCASHRMRRFSTKNRVAAIDKTLGLVLAWMRLMVNTPRRACRVRRPAIHLAPRGWASQADTARSRPARPRTKSRVGLLPKRKNTVGDGSRQDQRA
jgi:hypothetical protein